MSCILLTTLGSLGDLYPLIGLGLELRDRGHEIRFATVKDYQTRIEAIGFEFYAIRPDHVSVNDSDMLAMMMDLRHGPERVIRDYIFANIRETYADVKAAADGVDLIVAGELVYAARTVAEKMGIPWVLCVLAPGSFFSPYDPLVLPGFEGFAKLRSLGVSVNRAVMNFARFISRDWGNPLLELRRDLELPPGENPFMEGKYSSDLNLVLFSNVLGAPQPDWHPKSVQTGFVFYDEQSHKPNGQLEQFLAAGEAPIVFTLGSAAVLAVGDFYQTSLEAIKQLNRRAVLLIGQNPIPGNLPEHVMAIDYVPFSQILPRACAIVHQGGVGTTAQALRAGQPTIVVPYSHDQPDNADRVRRLGTSRTIHRDRYSVSKVVRELSELLDDPSYASRAAEVGKIVRSEHGVKMACDEIEDQLSRKN